MARHKDPFKCGVFAIGYWLLVKLNLTNGTGVFQNRGVLTERVDPSVNQLPSISVVTQTKSVKSKENFHTTQVGDPVFILYTTNFDVFAV